MRVPAPLSNARALATDPEVIAKYFDLLEETLIQPNLLNKPCQIYNMDETRLPLDAKELKCIYKKGERHPVARNSGDKSQITVVACVSASGTCMPPLVIINRKTLPAYFSNGEVPGTRYGLSTRGWIDQGLFHDWFCLHFLRYIPADRPVLLLMDGHSSHFNPNTIRLAAEQGVVIFVLPPNSTHILQPLDKGTFGPLKIYWRQECHKFMSENPGQIISKYSFSHVFSQAWDRCMTPRNLRAGFKVTGIYPFNNNAPFIDGGDTKRCIYLPMLSPAIPTRRHSVLSNTGLVVPTRRQLVDSDYEDVAPPQHQHGYSDSVYSMSPQDYSDSEDSLLSAKQFYQESGALSDVFPLRKKVNVCHLALSDIENSAQKIRHRALVTVKNHGRIRRDKTLGLSVSSLSDSSSSSHPKSMLYCSQAKQFLKTPIPPPRVNPKKLQCCGWVLTSLDNIEKMEVKEKEKEEKQRQKEERARIRQQKKLDKEKSKKSKEQSKKSKEQSKKSKAVIKKENFTIKELQLFEKRFQNGYDLETDERYNLWREQKNHDQTNLERIACMC